jgi:hypothetical protein
MGRGYGFDLALTWRLKEGFAPLYYVEGNALWLCGVVVVNPHCEASLLGYKSRNPPEVLPQPALVPRPSSLLDNSTT